MTSNFWMTSSSTAVSVHGDDRSALAGLDKFFDNAFLSDINLIVGGRAYPAHRVLLAKSSPVLERMFSPDWYRATNQILELVEEPACCEVFGDFLRFFYSNEVCLEDDTALPLLILADKYDVAPLQSLCSNFIKELIPKLDAREIFNVWFPYCLKTGHKPILQLCVQSLAGSMSNILRAEDWLDEFMAMEKEQLVALLRSNDLKIKEEYDLWDALRRWVNFSPDRLSESADLLQDLVPEIHFPMMSPTQLFSVERDPFVRQHASVIEPYIRMAYKYHALPLSLRLSNADFLVEAGSQLLARGYSEIRWQRRLVANSVSSIAEGTELAYRFNTRACAVPLSFWDWELKLWLRGTSQNAEDVRCQLVGVSVVPDSHCRAIEYLLALVTDKRVVDSVNGRRTVNRKNPIIDIEFQALAKRIDECVENDRLIFQVMIRPAA